MLGTGTDCVAPALTAVPGEYADTCISDKPSVRPSSRDHFTGFECAECNGANVRKKKPVLISTALK
jgi:hypothetical protein